MNWQRTGLYIIIGNIVLWILDWLNVIGVCTSGQQEETQNIAQNAKALIGTNKE